jgi:hypothetical protein
MFNFLIKPYPILENVYWIKVSLFWNLFENIKFLDVENGKHYAYYGVAYNKTCYSKGKIYNLELWWDHNSG